MKYFNTIAILFCSTILLFACKDNAKSSTAEPKTTTTNPGAVTPSQKTARVWHYTCSKGCAAGADTATNCATCGTLLAHNAAYHNQTNGMQPPVIAPPTINSPATNIPEPSQNSAGVWHYSCAKGCAGGSGTAGACSTCGNSLAHNVAYHQ